MEVVEDCWDLSSTAPSHVAQGFFSSFSPPHFLFSFLSYTNACEHTCLCVHHAYSLHVNGNPPHAIRHVWRSRPYIATVTPPIQSLPLFIHPVPLCPLCSVHLNQFGAQSYSHSCSSNSSLCTLIISLLSAEILLLVSSPFYQRHHLLIEQSSVFRDNVFSHIFTVIARCWHAGIIFLSLSWQTLVRPQTLLQIVEFRHLLVGYCLSW